MVTVDMSRVKLVNYGVDTLVVNAYYTHEGKPVQLDLPDEIAAQLNEWKRQAQAEGEPHITSWTFQGSPLLMQPNGAGRGQWQWMLKTHYITLYISTGKWNGIASVRCSSEYLWSSPDVITALCRVNALLYDLFANDMFLQLSSVDLCVDVAGWSDITTLDRRRNFVSRSRKRAEHYEPDEQPQGLHEVTLVDNSSGLLETGFDFSKRGVMSCTIYDKTRELKKSGKAWFLDLWRANGYSEDDGAVWRVEMKFKRETLHELKTSEFHGIEDAYDLAERLPVLWAYAAGHVQGGVDGLPDGWLRCVSPTSDTNRARWPTHPVWQQIQTAFSEDRETPEHFGLIVRQRRMEHNATKAVAALLGYSSSLSAWAGLQSVTTDDDTLDLSMLASDDLDLSVFLHWFAEHGEQVLQKQGRDFSDEVQRKRLKLGAL